ncbi:response regulator [uncultured Roseibium sp.]|uniref:response regulator transcription factor n=1 Tax=uncultured Roseibium sp. TaxID=1936171 RepID=UPI002619C6EF|nr:response regulator [uncultured Roseibium sp.]
MSEKSLISIVDDHDASREAVAGLVRSLGLVTAVFENAFDFLKSEEFSRTACLIADIRMPRMTGPELYNHLIATGTPIPTIFITAYVDERDRELALKAGVHCYLSKPLSPDDLLACIRSVISNGSEGPE